MSCFLRKTILFGYCHVRIPLPTSNLGFVRDPSVFSLRLFSSGSNQQSFAVSYLINELELSPESALKVSKHVNFENPEKPNKFINLFKKYGFTQTQVSSIVRRFPQLLSIDTEKILLPKLEFFDAKGVSWPQFAKRLSSFPGVLGRSLGIQIQPSYEFLRNFLQSDKKAIKAVERFPDILMVNVEKCLVPNIDVLRGHGVPDSNTANMVWSQPKAFTLTSDRFREVVEEVVEMGFDAKRVNFVQAVVVLRCLSKSTWECKINAYKRLGWSKEEISKAFERLPRCMTISEDKIMAGMDFFTNKMGLKPCLIANRPVLLNLSLKKRLIPRFSVFQVLLSKGLVKKVVRPSALLEPSEEKFLQKFVTPYKEKVPELLKLYKEKMNLPNGLLIEKA